MLRSYTAAFVALFVGLLILTDLAISSITYRHATRVSLDLSADILSEMSAKVVARTTALFEAARGFAEIDALLVAERGLDDHRSLLRLFGRQLALLPQLQSIYVAGPDGDFIQARRAPQLATRLIRRDDSSGTATERIVYRNQALEPIAHINGTARYDPRERDWYRQAVAADGLRWSSVYRFSNNGQRGITAAVAVREPSGPLIGVVGLDIALSSLSELLAEQRIARRGIALIVDGEGRLIASPHSVKLRTDTSESGELPRIDDLQATWLVDAYQQRVDAASTGSGMDSIDYTLTETAGIRYLGYQHPFPPGVGDDWRLMMVVPEASLLESARRLFSQAAVISFMLLLLAALAVSYLALRLLQPLKRLVLNTQLIREFRFAEVRRVPSWFTEIQAMDESIWRMSQGLRSLEKFVPQDVGRKLIESGKRIEPGAEVRELALLVTGTSEMVDLCGALPPERIMERLARAIDVFTETILRHKGTIDNFLGESILAFWGAPIATDRGAERACLAAIACRDAETALRAERAATLSPDEPTSPLSLFSVHYGRAIVGTIGSHRRMNWTAIGDNVTLVWDLHQLNRRYGTRILITGEVQRQVADRFWTRRLDVVPLGNATRALELYELIDTREHLLPPARMEAIERYELGLKALFDRDWDRAEPIFAALAERDPGDLAAAIMLSRCRARDVSFSSGLVDPGDEPIRQLMATRVLAARGSNLGGTGNEGGSEPRG